MGSEKAEFTVPVVGWAAHDASPHLSPFTFKRRQPGANDIKLNVKFCGVCHSDLHQISGEWGSTPLPLVPGHEITGIVTEVGSKVTKFNVGDIVGVGTIVNSCKNCEACYRGLEQYCQTRTVFTYASIDFDGSVTQGGYSNIMVVREDFVLKMPENLSLDAASPLLCAGITVYSPMKFYGMDKGGSFGVVGLGGLGHMAVRFAKAFGLKVTVISTSASKEKEAYDKLGADHFVISTDEAQMKTAASSLDFLIDTVSAPHPMDPYMKLLKLDGKYVFLGMPENDEAILKPTTMVYGRKTCGGSLVGGIKETQEMLDFCGKHNVLCDIEKIPITYINEAMVRLRKADVHYRFVIDIENTLKAEK